MTETTTRSAEDMVAEADTGARNAGPFVAFLMVEYVNIPYIEVVKHALLPAVVS